MNASPGMEQQGTPRQATFLSVSPFPVMYVQEVRLVMNKTLASPNNSLGPPTLPAGGGTSTQRRVIVVPHKLLDHVLPLLRTDRKSVV